MPRIKKSIKTAFRKGFSSKKKVNEFTNAKEAWKKNEVKRNPLHEDELLCANVQPPAPKSQIAIQSSQDFELFFENLDIEEANSDLENEEIKKYLEPSFRSQSLFSIDSIFKQEPKMITSENYNFKLLFAFFIIIFFLIIVCCNNK